MSTQIASGYGIGIPDSKNLQAYNNGATPNTKVDVTADYVKLVNSGAALAVHPSVSLTIDTGTTGANGLDTGTLQASTWYYIWLISNVTTCAGLISTSRTAPTMPSGYTYKGLFGAVRTNGSTQFTKFFQAGREVGIAKTNVTNNITLSSTPSSVDLSSVIPPNANAVWGMVGNIVQFSAIAVGVAADNNGSSGIGAMGFYLDSAQSISTTSDGYCGAVGFRIPVKTSQTIYWYLPSGSGANSAGYRMDISGFVLW